MPTNVEDARVGRLWKYQRYAFAVQNENWIGLAIWRGELSVALQ